MSPSLLPGVDELTSRLIDDLAASAGPAAWQIRGNPAAGKSTALANIEQQLDDGAAGDLVPILVSPPHGAADAGPLALLQIGEAMARREDRFDAPDLDLLRDPERPWTDKQSSIEAGLQGAAESLVLLCDEPAQWPSQGGVYDRAAKSLRRSVVYNGLDCRKIITGRVSADVKLENDYVLDAQSNASALFDDHEWRSLSGVAHGLFERFGEQLNEFSPLSLRLLVGHAVVHSVEAIGSEQLNEPEEELALQLLQSFRDRHEPVYRSWVALSQARTAVSVELLDHINAPAEGDTDGDLLRCCLLYERRGGMLLHEILRRAVVDDLGRSHQEVRQAHESLAGYFSDRFASMPTDSRSLVEEMEAFHHASRANANSLDTLKPFFTEQLGGLAFELSWWHREYQRAADTYERVLVWDPEDDYAHHYRAWNLDVLAREPEAVECHYEKALSIDDSRDRWHASLINFFIARARVPDARKAWEAARERFESADGDLSVAVVQNLHLKVARHLLEFGEVDFGLRVLRGVSPTLRTEVPGLETVSRKLAAMRLSRDHGNFVPGFELRSGWWQKGPFLVEGLEQEELVEWVAGEVERADEESVALHAAFIRPNISSEEPPSGNYVVAAEQCRNWDGPGLSDLAVGDFVEIGTFVGPNGERTQWAMHERRNWTDESLPRERPDPLRYLDGS